MPLAEQACLPTPPRREVVSFTRRGDRLKPGLKKAWDAHADRYVVPVPRGARSTSVAQTAVVDWGSLFGRRAPMVLEIGSGVGEVAVGIAAVRPELDVLAVEVYRPGVAATVRAAARLGLGNLRLVEADAVEVLTHVVEPESLAEVWTFFPDPWHKLRHHKRRMVTPAFADLVASRLAPGGTWRLATDWSDYAEQMRVVLDGCPMLADPHDGAPAPRWVDRPMTKFERKGMAAGRAVTDLERVRRRQATG